MSNEAHSDLATQTGSEVAERLISFRILLTERCDLACVFCHIEGQSRVSADLDVPAHQLATLVRIGREFGRTQVKFSGGEPLLHPRIAEYIGAIYDEDVDDTVIISNGNRPDTFRELLSSRLGRFRVSLNLPAAHCGLYRGVTGGDLAKVMQTVAVLREAGVCVSANSYWPGAGRLRQLDGLVELANRAGIALKILIPCQTAASEAIENLSREADQQLRSLGFVLSSRWHHVSFYHRRGQTVRLQRPWCPVLFVQARQEARSIRVTARGFLRSCLVDEGETHGRIDEPLEALRHNVAVALSCAGQHCAVPGRRGVRVVPRWRLS